MDVRNASQALAAARKLLAKVPADTANPAEQTARRIAEHVERTITGDAELMAAIAAAEADGTLMTNPAEPSGAVRLMVAARQLRQQLGDLRPGIEAHGGAEAVDGFLGVLDVAEMLAQDLDRQQNRN